MTRKQLITACVEKQIERGIVKKENKEMQINIRLNGGHSGQKPMLKAECQRWYDELFKTEERKEEEVMIKNNQEQKNRKVSFEVGQIFFSGHLFYEIVKRTEKTVTIKEQYTKKLRRCKIHEIEYKGTPCYGRIVEYIYPTGRTCSDIRFDAAFDYKISRKVIKHRQKVKQQKERENKKYEIERKEEKKMTKKQIIEKCVEEKIKRGSIKEENKEKEINAKLNGVGNWLKPMNKAQCQSWYDDLFKPEYQIIKEELKEKINNWFEENNIEANYLDSEFYDNGNGKGLHIEIKWEQKEEFDNLTHQYFYHFKIKDIDIEAIFATWVKYIEQVEQDKRIIEELEETKEERENKNIIRNNNQEQSERKKEISENKVLKFEVGKKYVCSSVVNSNSRYEFEVIKRTEKNITIKNSDEEVIKRKINTNQKGTVELVYPDRKYSMCLVLSADDIKEEKINENIGNIVYVDFRTEA